MITATELEKINEILAAISKGVPFEFPELSSFEDETGKNILLNLMSINQKITELNVYSSSLAKGDLDVDFPPRNNYLVGGLKELHSNLLHLTWKVNQISRGDYNQKVDFMGQFSTAFNEMVERLKKRDFQLSESRNLVEVLFMHSNIMVFVMDAKTGELIYGKEKEYSTHFDSEFSPSTKNIIEKLHQKNVSSTARISDWDLYSEVDSKWYTVKSMAMTWTDSQDVFFHMLFDISEQKIIQERLELAILKDSKTGAYNDSYAIEQIGYLMDSGKAFSICFFDLDGLKSVNDTLGHVAGDRMIQLFVDIITKTIRPHDSFCRMGGDEFMLISPQADLDITKKIIERIESKIQLINESKNEPYSLAFSYGIEMYDSSSNLSAQQLIDNADKKMYNQKNLKKLFHQSLTR